MTKILTYYSLIVSSFVMSLAFASATTYTQLAGAVLLFPMFAYFVLRILPRRQRVHTQMPTTITQPVNVQIPQNVRATVQEPQEEYYNEVVDIDKRAFLKLVGAAGLSLFISSIFVRRAEAAFFGSAPNGPLALKDSKGKQIDPAERQPTDGYQITEIDDSITAYFGFTNKDGAWFIMREDTETGSFRYTKGDSNFLDGWTKREQLAYDYFHNAF